MDLAVFYNSCEQLIQGTQHSHSLRRAWSSLFGFGTFSFAILEAFALSRVLAALGYLETLGRFATLGAIAVL